MANILKDKPPILSQTEPLAQLREMQGLSLILGRVSESDTIQNSSESINNFKNSMVYARSLTWGDFSRVAAVQPGERKFTSSAERPTAYRPDGTSVVSQQSGKSYALDGAGYLHLILGNSNLNWREDLYDSENFAKGIPSYKGNGMHTTSSGWEYFTIGKMFDGVTDEAGAKWFPITNYMDQWTELKGLNLKNEKAQATRICGSSNEQTTGTCCLYYKENYYDAVAGVTWSAGDYYKCTCAKCYQCLHMARKLNMDYMFTKFTGTGPTGGTGDRCQDCDLDNYPTDCGPCPCTIGNYDKFDVILNDKYLPEKGLAKTNARIAKNWNHDLKGTVIVHCNLNLLDYTKREINASYWGADKILEFDGQQEPGKTTKTVYRLATEVINNKEYIIGLTLETTGAYTSMPEFPEDKLINMVPGLNKSHFRMVMLPDFSKLSEVSELVGGTRVQVNTTINISDIVDKTNISNFNVYGFGVLKTQKDEPYFVNTTNLSTSSRLTYRNKNVDKSGGTIYASLAEAIEAEKKKSNNQIKTTSGINTSISNSKAINTSKTDIEIYAGNKTDFTKDFVYVDSGGSTWTADNTTWLKPTSLTTGEELDAQKTDVLHVNGFNLSIPKADEGIHSVPGLINHTIKVTLTL